MNHLEFLALSIPSSSEEGGFSTATVILRRGTDTECAETGKKNEPLSYFCFLCSMVLHGYLGLEGRYHMK